MEAARRYRKKQKKLKDEGQDGLSDARAQIATLEDQLKQTEALAGVVFWELKDVIKIAKSLHLRLRQRDDELAIVKEELCKKKEEMEAMNGELERVRASELRDVGEQLRDSELQALADILPDYVYEDLAFLFPVV